MDMDDRRMTAEAFAFLKVQKMTGSFSHVLQVVYIIPISDVSLFFSS